MYTTTTSLKNASTFDRETAHALIQSWRRPRDTYTYTLVWRDEWAYAIAVDGCGPRRYVIMQSSK